MNFNNDGDKILTGAFDGTAIVINLFNKRFGIQEQASQSIYYKDIRLKYQAHNFSSVGTFVVHHQLIKHADCGMSVQESVWLYWEDIVTRFLILTLMQLELVWLLAVLTKHAEFIMYQHLHALASSKAMRVKSPR